MSKYYVLYAREDQIVRSYVGNDQVIKLLADGTVKSIIRLATNQVAELKDGQVFWKDLLEEEVV